MLTCRLRVKGQDEDYATEVTLSGKLLTATVLRWSDETKQRGDGWRPTGEVLGYGEWDFDTHAVLVIDDKMPPELVPGMNSVFGKRLRKLERPRQRGLLSGHQCCVCGETETTYPEHAVRDEYGNVLELGGRPQVSPPSPVQWECNVCGRLVCRKCTLTREDRAGPEYYCHTYCSEACRASAPPEFAAEDDL